MELVNSLSINKNIYLKTTHSTNEYAYNFLSKSNPNENYCIYSYNQTQGKGQIGRFWFNGFEQNLALTLIVSLNNLKVKDQFLLNIATSLGVLNYLMTIFPDQKLSIKWPNDIYIGNKKIAGILIQNQLRHSVILRTVIGIGLNINQEEFDSAIPNPISMFQIDKMKRDLLEEKTKLEKELLIFLSKMQVAKKMQRNIYLQHLFRINETHNYKIEDKVFSGQIKNIDEEGRLQLLVEDQIQAFNFREIKYII